MISPERLAGPCHASLRRLIRNDKGATAIEYGWIAGLIAVAITNAEDENPSGMVHMPLGAGGRYVALKLNAGAIAIR